MKKIIFLILILSQFAFAQVKPNRYEVEILMNPNKGGKDTREVNSVLVFEKDSVKVNSRRKMDLTYKDFKYTDLKFVEHSFSKMPFTTAASRAAYLTFLIGLPVFYFANEKHWLTLMTDDDFAVLKVENDNYRLLKMEFMVRGFDVVNINENKE